MFRTLTIAAAALTAFALLVTASMSVEGTSDRAPRVANAAHVVHIAPADPTL